LRPLDAILERLGCSQTAFFRAADSVSPKQWKTKPKAGEWSAAELVAHLRTVERAILGGAERITRRIPKPIPFLKRFPFPNVAGGEQDHSAQISDSPGSQSAEHEGRMLGELRAARERTLAFLEETSKKDLSMYCWPHPFLGMLNGYEWFEPIASHEIRHTKQMREITARLPKAVESA